MSAVFDPSLGVANVWRQDHPSGWRGVPQSVPHRPQIEDWRGLQTSENTLGGSMFIGLVCLGIYLLLVVFLLWLTGGPSATSHR